jgi:hypothetical protein
MPGGGSWHSCANALKVGMKVQETNFSIFCALLGTQETTHTLLWEQKSQTQAWDGYACLKGSECDTLLASAGHQYVSYPYTRKKILRLLRPDSQDATMAEGGLYMYVL